MEKEVKEFEEYLKRRGYAYSTICVYMVMFKKMLRDFGRIPSVDEMDKCYKSLHSRTKRKYRSVIYLYDEMVSSS